MERRHEQDPAHREQNMATLMSANLRGENKRDDVIHREEKVVQQGSRLKKVATTLQGMI